MKVGTRSVLYGAHAFWIHPIIVAIAWIKLYGFPFSIPIWTSFFVHDLGYWGKPNMDGEEGEKHPEVGARIMHKLFDHKHTELSDKLKFRYPRVFYWKWHDFTLYHSRFYAKKNNAPISKLCVADKYAICLDPWWFYLIRATLSGEIDEYFNTFKEDRPKFNTKREWLKWVKQYLNEWVKEHKDNLNDSWTKVVPINKDQIAEQTKNNSI